MTPPDDEEAPSALSRLERALAGFGNPKAAAPPEAAPPEPAPEAQAEPELAAESVAEPEPEPQPEEEEKEEPAADAWAPPSSSVLDIAAAVAAVEQLSAHPEPAAPTLTADEDALGEPASDADAVVLAATAAGTAPSGTHEEADAGEADEDEAPEAPRFEPADLRARIHEFATESDEAEPEPEPELALHAETETEPVEAEPVEAEPLEAEADEADAEPPTWQRNLGDTALPYFLVENDTPEPEEPVLPAVTATSSVEDLRATLVRPMPKAAAEPKPPASIARTLAEIPVLLVVAAVIAFLVKTFLAQAYYIPSGSMLPQLQINDRVVVTKLAYKAHDPRRGDIIVFDDPRPGASNGNGDEGLLRKVGEGIGIVQPSTDEFIKRVIGLPGETVEGKHGHVYINGHRLIEPYLKPSVVTSDFAPVKVQQGKLWVMGDNRTGSADSRVFGQIKINTIVGRAMVKVWPFDHISFL